MHNVFFVHSGQAALLIDLQSVGIETLWVPRHDAIEVWTTRDIDSWSWDESAVLLPWLSHMNDADVLWRPISFRQRLLSKAKMPF